MTTPIRPMTCERAAELLPDYLQGALGGETEDQLEMHLHECSGCSEMVTLWNELGALPEEQPSPMLRARFNSMLNAYQAGRTGQERVVRPEVNWWTMLWRPAAAMAAAAVLLAVGFAGGKYFSDRTNRNEQKLIALEQRLDDMRQVAMLSMLQQQSASARLTAVSMSTQQPQTDEKILEALLQTLRSDSSVDVRLAVVDALALHRNQPMVRDGLRQALQPDQSPLVQLALIREVVEMRDRNAVAPLQKIKETRDVNPLVRERVDWALSRLH